MIKLIIFDWDDVVTIGAKDGYYACYRKAIESVGVSLPEDELDRRIKKKWGQPYREELKEILREHADLVDKACEVYQAHKYGDTFLSALTPVPGVRQVLTSLSRRFLLAVATANQPAILDKIIEKFKIPKVFSQIVTAYDKDIPPEKTKPDPLMLRLILEKQGVSNNEALYVGDAGNDVLMARNANVQPVVVLTGHLSRRDAQDLQVDWIIPDVTHLPEVLRSLAS